MNIAQKIALIILLCLFIPKYAWSQAFSDLADGLHTDVEMSGTVSNGNYAPMWLSSNRQGLVSTREKSGYLRLGIFRDIEEDSTRTWKRGYGVDFLGSLNAESKFMIHQAFFESEFMKARITVGQKERQIDLRNNELTSGGLSLGINASPIPQVLLNIDYFSIPFTKGWWKWKGRIGYGYTTDGKWQENFTEGKTKYNSNHFYHEKALYWKFGKETARIVPLTFEIGIQMMTQFGGTSFNAGGRNHNEYTPIKHPEDLKAFWQAFNPIGSAGETDGVNQNATGNTVGSYNMALTWHGKNWHARAYFERLFEDQSMLTIQYGVFYDHILGCDVNLPKNKYISSILVEHINTTDQSGPVFHDGTANIPESYAGVDNYYNHSLYSGWQHWGMGLGNPLLTSPLYNSDKTIQFKNNRIRAWHIGLSGDPSPNWHWRVMASFTTNLGTYFHPYSDFSYQQNYLAEVSWKPYFKGKSNIAKGWIGKFALGYDHGTVIGNSFGGQITIHKSFILVKGK